MSDSPTDASAHDGQTSPHGHHLRFHLPIFHRSSVFGDNWFALKAEAFARFFGTPSS